jgi:hypothetical protein
VPHQPFLLRGRAKYLEFRNSRNRESDWSPCEVTAAEAKLVVFAPTVVQVSEAVRLSVPDTSGVPSTRVFN